MIHTMTFTLPLEREELQLAMDAGKLSSSLWDFYHDFLRKQLKYEEISEEKRAILEEVRTEFFRILEENGALDYV